MSRQKRTYISPENKERVLNFLKNGVSPASVVKYVPGVTYIQAYHLFKNLKKANSVLPEKAAPSVPQKSTPSIPQKSAEIPEVQKIINYNFNGIEVLLSKIPKSVVVENNTISFKF